MVKITIKIFINKLDEKIQNFDPFAKKKILLHWKCFKLLDKWLLVTKIFEKLKIAIVINNSCDKIFKFKVLSNSIQIIFNNICTHSWR